MAESKARRPVYPVDLESARCNRERGPENYEPDSLICKGALAKTTLKRNEVCRDFLEAANEAPLALDPDRRIEPLNEFHWNR